MYFDVMEPVFYIYSIFPRKVRHSCLNPFVTSPRDLRGLGRPFWYEPLRFPGQIAWDNYDVIK